MKQFFLIAVLCSYSFFNAYAQFNSILKSPKTIEVQLKEKDTIRLDTLGTLDSMVLTLSAPLLNFKKVVQARLPLNKFYVTSPFGLRFHPILKKVAHHAGIDLRARSDTVFSIMYGTVANASYSSTLGYNVVVNHGLYTSIYGHLSQIFVSPGQLVSPQTRLGITGSTGRSLVEHLHFVIQYKGKAVNPLPILLKILNTKMNTEESIKKKLLLVASGKQVELNEDEAALYSVEVADKLPLEDLEDGE